MKSELQEVVSRRDRVLRWVKSQGAVFCADPAELDLLKSYLREMAFVSPLLQWGLSAIYVYRQGDQSCDLKNCDAICWRDVTTDGFGVLFAIGISVEALANGKDYTALCFLHELTHIVNSSLHSASFHTTLNHLIEKYNYVTGSKLKNDYSGL